MAQHITDTALVPWHLLPVEEVFKRTASRLEGLTAAEATRRLAEHSPNRLRPPPRQGALRRFLAQSHNVLIYVLLAASVVTALLGHCVDTGVILGVVVVSALMGFIQEGKAERALEGLRRMLTLHATVLRDGQRLVVPAESVVRGVEILQQSDVLQQGVQRTVVIASPTSARGSPHRSSPSFSITS